jgi:flagellar assembly protein FliH
MSSSNIIKPTKSTGFTIESYQFGSVQNAVTAANSGSGAGFVPYLDAMFVGADNGNSIGQEEDCGLEGHVPTVIQQGIPEEEHYQQVQEAYDKGFAEGKRQAERGLANVFKALRDAVEELSGLRSQVLRESEEDLLKLAILVARKVIHQEIATDRLILSKIVAAAVSSTSERDEIVIRLNPDDYRLVNAHKSLYLNGLSADRFLELKSDDTIALGGCIIDTVMGEVDARTDAQVDEIFKKLLEERSSHAAITDNIFDERGAYVTEDH